VHFDVHRVHDPNPNEVTQRTRPFLFASLGAVVADRLGLPEVALADNGVVSLNLPINEQLIGTTASRSTHPGVLRRFNELARLVFTHPPLVLNPLWALTRTECLALLRDTGLGALVAETNSCSKGRALAPGKRHCGTCSQCIDRRIATTAAGLARFDPAEQYYFDLYRDPLQDGRDRVMALSYVRFALTIEELQDPDALLRRFPQLFDAVDPHDPDRAVTRAQLIDLLHRHAHTVLDTLGEEIGRHSTRLIRPNLSPNCLLRLISGPSGTIDQMQTDRIIAAAQALEAQKHAPPRFLFQRHRDTWTVVFEGHVTPLPNLRGLHYLNILLKRPNHAIDALDLIRLVQGTGAAGDASYAKLSVEQLQAEGLSVTNSSGLPVADTEALRQYREALADLQEEIMEAEQNHDNERASRLRREQRQILGEIRRSTRHGKIRTRGGDTEKARSAVTHAIESVIKRLALDDQPLADHLRRSIRCGNQFAYAPTEPIQWTFLP